MSGQRLGPKKHRRCEEITGQKYDRCIVRAGDPHFWADCVRRDGETCDFVNYRTGEWEPGSFAVFGLPKPSHEDVAVVQVGKIKAWMPACKVEQFLAEQRLLREADA
jgi:hypothetical protein